MGKNRRKPKKRPGQKQRWSLSVVNKGGYSPNQEVIREYHERTLSIGQRLPVTLGLTEERAKGPNAIPRAVVLYGSREDSHFQQELNQCVLVNLPHKKISMFFGGRKFFFVQENKDAHTVTKSIIYQDRDRAMKVFKRGRIYWLPPVSVSVEALTPAHR